jgi:hypothetical protein
MINLEISYHKDVRILFHEKYNIKKNKRVICCHDHAPYCKGSIAEGMMYYINPTRGFGGHAVTNASTWVGFYPVDCTCGELAL